jgi:hypothetical protein
LQLRGFACQFLAEQAIVTGGRDVGAGFGKPKQGLEVSGLEGEPVRLLDFTREQIDTRINELLEKGK